MKAFLIGLAVIAALTGLTACGETKTIVTKKDGAVNPSLCTGQTPYIMRIKTGRAGDVLKCVNQTTFDKYNVGDVFP